MRLGLNQHGTHSRVTGSILLNYMIDLGIIFISYKGPALILFLDCVQVPGLPRERDMKGEKLYYFNHHRSMTCSITNRNQQEPPNLSIT